MLDEGDGARRIGDMREGQHAVQRIGERLHFRADQDDVIDPIVAQHRRDVGMEFRAAATQFAHPAQHRQAPVGRLAAQLPQRRRHRQRIGIIAFID